MMTNNRIKEKNNMRGELSMNSEEMIILKMMFMMIRSRDIKNTMKMLVKGCYNEKEGLSLKKRKKKLKKKMMKKDKRNITIGESIHNSSSSSNSLCNRVVRMHHNRWNLRLGYWISRHILLWVHLIKLRDSRLKGRISRRIVMMQVRNLKRSMMMVIMNISRWINSSYNKELTKIT